MPQPPLVQTAANDLPMGFPRGPGGLLVPIGESTREHEGWRWEDGMAIRRAYRVAQLHNVLLMVGCNDDRCAETPLISVVDLPGGGFAWVCGHKERHVTKGPKPGRRPR